MVIKYLTPITLVLLYNAAFILFQWRTYIEIGDHYLDMIYSLDGSRLLATGLLLPSLGIFGLWFAHHRSEQTSEQIDLHLQSQDQQLFFDAIKFIASSSDDLKLLGFQAVRNLVNKSGFQYKSEAKVALNSFLRSELEEAQWQHQLLGIATGETGVFIVGKYALLALAALGSPTPSANRTDQSQRGIIGACLAGLSVESHIQFGNETNSDYAQTKIDSIKFCGCDLRDCGFIGVLFSNVTFGTFSSPPRPPIHTDLTNTSFMFAEFNGVDFGTSNISGVEFGASKGLTEIALALCIYNFDQPPRNLRSGFVLRHPAFRSLDELDQNGDRRILPLEPSCIPEFCDLHEGFEPHGEDQIITVAVERTEENED